MGARAVGWERRRRRGLGAILVFAVSVLLAGLPAGAGRACAQSAPHPAAAAGAPVPSPALTPSRAGASPAAPAPAFDFAAADQTLTRLQNRVAATTDDRTLQIMAAQAAAVDGAANRLYASQEAQVTRLQDQLRRTPFRRRAKPAEAQARAALVAEHAAAASQAAQTRAVVARAEIVFSQIAERRREGFSARVLEQTASPLDPDFWTALASATGTDLARLEAMTDRVLEVAAAAPQPRAAAGVLLGLLSALFVVWPLRRLCIYLGWRRARRLGERSATHVVALVWQVLVEVAAPTMAAEAIRLGLRWGGLLATPADLLAQAAVGAVAWAATVLALGRALATARDRSARLLDLGDDEAGRARATLWVVAAVTAAGFFLQKLNYVVGTSVSATIASNCVVALAYAAAAFLIVTSFGRTGAGAGTGADAAADGEETAADHQRAPAWTVVSLALAGAVAATVGAVLCGYTTLAALIAGQIFWLSLIAAAALLLLRLVDGVFAALFRPHGRAFRVLQQLFGLQTSTIAQLGLLISAGVQVMVVLIAMMLALTPFGGSGERLIGHIRSVGGDLQFGKIIVSPLSIVGGLATFVVGVGLSHMVRAWVERRYLPVTRWDAGLRNSVATGVSYLGVIIALIAALAVTGVGLAQMALVASALSVGIGFGLQQIVQNFVAGVILLIERPVKVGDWVNVGGVEGDVLDIRVRATDIRSRDGSTVIVPNSTLITTNVENKTLGHAQTRIQLQVAITKAADVAKARDAILEVAGRRDDVLKRPAPEVYIDALTAGGGANLNAWLYVAEPRAAARIRSEIYFALLEAFQGREIAM